MARHVSQTPATAALRAAGVEHTEHPYDYVEHGGTAESARQLGVDEHAVVKTLVMVDAAGQPWIVLMHGDRQVATQTLARQVGVKSLAPADPAQAERWSGYRVGGLSPFGFRRVGVPVLVERSVLALPRILINGGRRGFLVGIAPRVLVERLGARPVDAARDAAGASGKRADEGDARDSG